MQAGSDDEEDLEDSDFDIYLLVQAGSDDEEDLEDSDFDLDDLDDEDISDLSGTAFVWNQTFVVSQLQGLTLRPSRSSVGCGNALVSSARNIRS